jgi:hypothetical protein
MPALRQASVTVLVVALLLAYRVAGMRVVGDYTAQGLTLSEPLFLDTPRTVIISDSVLTVVILNGSAVRDAAVSFVRTRISNFTVTATLTNTRVAFDQCVLGSEFVDAPASASEWVYASPTTAVLFSAPLFSCQVSLTGTAVHASQRGVHFGTVVRQTSVTVSANSTVDTQCLEAIGPTSNSTPACASVFGISSDFRFEAASSLTINQSTVRVLSQRGSATAVYFVEVLSGAAIAVDGGSRVEAQSDVPGCWFTATHSAGAYSVRALTVSERASVTLTHSRFSAVSLTGCRPWAVSLGTVSRSSVTVSSNTYLAAITNSTRSPTFATIDISAVGGVSELSFADNAIISCNGTVNCAALRIGDLADTQLRVRRNANVTSQGDCFAVTNSGGRSRGGTLVLLDSNTMWCGTLFFRVPAAWGPFVAPSSQFVGRCNVMRGVELLPSTLPALIPPFMETVPTCTQCQRALDCVAEATASVSGVVGSCRCACLESFIHALHAGRKVVSVDCSYVSATATRSRSPTFSDSSSFPVTRTRTGTRTPNTSVSSSASTSPTGLSASHSGLPTDSLTRSRTPLPSPSLSVSDSKVHVPTPKELLEESIEKRVPRALIVATIVASVLASLYSPTLSNKAVTIMRLVGSVDCYPSADKLEPIVYLDVVAVGTDATSRLLGPPCSRRSSWACH